MMKSIDAFHEFERLGWGTGRVCEEYDHHFGAVTSQSVQAMLDAAGVTAGSRVLDVCCGAGYAAAGAAQRGAEVVGVDFSPAQVEMARTRNPSLRFEVGDGCDLGMDQYSCRDPRNRDSIHSTSCADLHAD